MLAMMHNRRLGHLLDIGTGTGRMAEIFAPTARRITALDRSPEMLRIARAKLAGQAIPVDLVQGDFLNLPVGDASVDSIVIHQALHFAHEPDRVIAEASRVLRGGGHLLVADFAPHEDEALRNLAAQHTHFSTRRFAVGSPRRGCCSKTPKRWKAASWR